MKFKSFFLSALVLFITLQLNHSRMGIPIAQAQTVSQSAYSLYLPLVIKAESVVIPTVTPQHTNTPTNTATRTHIPTLTNTPTSTLTRINTPTSTTTSTTTSSPTATATRTSTATNTPTGTMTLTNTPTNTATRTPTGTATRTPTTTYTPAGTLTLTNTPTSTPTWTKTPTSTMTRTKTATSTATSSPTATLEVPLYKFGIVLGRSSEPFSFYSSYGISSMRFGWYVDYKVTADASSPNGVEYVPTVRVKQLKLAADGVTKVTCRVGDYYVTPYEYTVSPNITEIKAIASRHPGMTWLIGNEIERRDWGSSSSCGGQDEILPELYAQAYHDIYTAIKAADPTAKVANGSLVEFTPLRQQYLDRVWAEYSRLAALNGWAETTMPVDVWNMHFFALRERSCTTYPNDCWGAAIPAGLSAALGVQYSFPDDNWDFTNLWEQVVLLRTWMKAHGQQNKPLLTSEYGVNYPYSYFSCFDSSDETACPRELRDRMMYPSFNAFLNQTDSTIGDSLDGNRLVQRWAWWSLDYDYGTCDSGVYYEDFGGALFGSGLGPSSPPYTCSYPAKGMTLLGTYWKQYVQSLP
jgi:hypothetical protein